MREGDRPRGGIGVQVIRDRAGVVGDGVREFESAYLGSPEELRVQLTVGDLPDVHELCAWVLTSVEPER